MLNGQSGGGSLGWSLVVGGSRQCGACCFLGTDEPDLQALKNPEERALYQSMITPSGCVFVFPACFRARLCLWLWLWLCLRFVYAVEVVRGSQVVQAL